MPSHAPVLRPFVATTPDATRPAPDRHDELDTLLTSLRQDVAWLDRCLAEQAAGSDDEVRTLRMQMRIRCDGMGDQLARVAGHLERIAAGPHDSGAAAPPRAAPGMPNASGCSRPAPPA